METTERAQLMALAYGEAVSYAKAGKILGGRHPDTVKAMIADGRLSPACEGTRVDIYSIAAYIAAPKQMDFEARKQKYINKTGCRFYV